MEKMVTVEVLKKSQPTRPRKWVPVACFIMLLLTVSGAFSYFVLLFPDLPLSAKLLGYIDAVEMTMGDLASFREVLKIVILPASLLFIDLFALIFLVKMCNYRKFYWIFGWFYVVLFIAMILLTGFSDLFFLVTYVRDLVQGIPADILNLILMFFYYGTFGLVTLLAVAMIFGVFYNVNYPAKYEEVYALRKARLKSLHTHKERKAYKARFYNDYKKGNWTSMMLDLHYRAFIPDSIEPMRRDAFEFFAAYCCERDTQLKRAIFDQYAREGRFFECRKIYQGIAERSDAIERGARVVLPHYVPDPAAKAHKPAASAPRPAPASAPLAPDDAPAPNPNSRKWTPEDIG